MTKHGWRDAELLIEFWTAGSWREEDARDGNIVREGERESSQKKQIECCVCVRERGKEIAAVLCPLSKGEKELSLARSFLWLPCCPSLSFVISPFFCAVYCTCVCGTMLPRGAVSKRGIACPRDIFTVPGTRERKREERKLDVIEHRKEGGANSY